MQPAPASLRLGGLAVAALLVAACGREETVPASDPLPARVDRVVTSADVLLDVAADGAVIAARERPLPVGTDGDRRLDARLVDRAGRARAIGDGPVSDARVLAGDAVVALDARGDLVVHSASGRAPRRIDGPARGPLAVAGGRVAYARGHAPDLEIALWDGTDAPPRPVTEGYRPAWSPALSEDGSLVAFVSARTGSPEVYVARDGAIRQVTRRGRGARSPFPASAWAPRVVDGTLVFDDRAGVHGMDLATGLVRWTRAGLAQPIPVAGGALLARGASGIVEVDPSTEVSR